MNPPRLLTLFALLTLTIGLRSTHAEDYSVTIETPVTAPEGSYWMHVRAGTIPTTEVPLVVVTMQLTDHEGTHMFHGLSSMWTDDLGKTWHGPTKQATLERRIHDNGMIEVPCDTTPAWHAASNKLLLTGATFWLDPKIKRHAPDGASDTPYSFYDPTTHSWSQWQILEMPDDPKFHFARAGCTQRVDLENGDILLPIYFDGRGNDSRHSATIARCRFDGQKLSLVEHGDELRVEVKRGFVEPSLAHFRNKFFLTLRNDKKAYVASGDDGLHFSEPKPWTFDDGEELGSYNTQAHWVTRKDNLYLVYTRKGVGNDDIFRHRAPLLMARVDTEKLVVIRDTERIILPKVGAGFGNFGVCNVTEKETWVIAGRRLAKLGDPSVYIARIRWGED